MSTYNNARSRTRIKYDVAHGSSDWHFRRDSGVRYFTRSGRTCDGNTPQHALTENARDLLYASVCVRARVRFRCTIRAGACVQRAKFVLRSATRSPAQRRSCSTHEGRPANFALALTCWVWWEGATLTNKVIDLLLSDRTFFFS